MLNISNISKSFKENIVLKKVCLTVKEGECHCLIGKNGSGKSTLINILIDVMEPDTGNITFWGEDINSSNSIKSKIGVLPEFNPVIDEFNIYDYLKYIGLLYGLDDELIKKRCEYLIEYFFEDTPKKKKPIGQFSKGMKLKTGICAALIHKPQLLILDEPFDGLDVFSANSLVTFLNEYRKEGNSIFVSSHDMLFMEKIATHVSVIKDKEVLNFPVSEFKRNGKPFEEHVSAVMGYNPKEVKVFV